ncbi:hypothetical protein HRbin26_01605 [bacterium HR26]|nr:hypothetical protein HRbin26_01605 [bacterium HR26]
MHAGILAQPRAGAKPRRQHRATPSPHLEPYRPSVSGGINRPAGRVITGSGVKAPHQDGVGKRRAGGHIIACHAPALCVDRRRSDGAHPAGRGGGARGARRADQAAGGRVRLEQGRDLAGRRHQHPCLRPGRAASRLADRSLRPTPGHARRRDPNHRRAGPTPGDARPLADAPLLGAGHRRRHRRGERRARRDGGDPLVQETSRGDHRRLRRGHLRRPARLPAAPGNADGDRWLAQRDRHARGRLRGAPAADCPLDAQPPCGHRPPPVRRRWGGVAGCRAGRRGSAYSAAGRAPHARLLAAGRQLLHLRLHDERPDRHPPDPACGRARLHRGHGR